MNVNIAPDIVAKELSAAKNLDDYYAKLVPAGMGAGWNKSEPSLYPAPKNTFLPANLSYRTARRALDAAARLVRTEDAERRNLILHKHVAGHVYGTASTILSAYQMIYRFEAAHS